MSEALFALGVPTSRCLSVVTTGEMINRGLAKAGAVVTRVAASHIRVGTFQYFAARGDKASLQALVDYSIARHFPDIDMNETGQNRSLSSEERILAFLSSTIAKQITLVVEWLRIGFIHGVMNTDNTAICGETLDFGPCAMLGEYDVNKVYSSIDEYGRYAFGNQGKIAHWNMARLADCLIPLLVNTSDEELTKSEQEDEALTKVEALIHQYNNQFDVAYFTMYSKKLGIFNLDTNNVTLNHKELINELLVIMQAKHLDYTQTFLQLTKSLTDDIVAQEVSHNLGGWYQKWLSVVGQVEPSYQGNSQSRYQQAQALMQENNPVVIPRNHHVEAMLDYCESIIGHDPSSINSSTKEMIANTVEEFLEVLRSPYQEIEGTKKYQDTAGDSDKYYQTFCGT